MTVTNIIGVWPSGKASDSGSEDHRFESYHPSHLVFIPAIAAVFYSVEPESEVLTISYSALSAGRPFWIGISHSKGINSIFPP